MVLATPQPVRVHVIFVGKELAYSALFVGRRLLESVDSRFRGNDRGVAAVMRGKREVKGQRIYLQS